MLLPQDLSELEPFEQGVMLLCLLMGDRQTKVGFHDRFAGIYQLAMTELAGSDNELRFKQFASKPFYASRPVSKLKHLRNSLVNALNDRILAAHFAIHYLKETFGQTPAAILGRKDATRLSHDNILTRIAEYEVSLDVDNFEQRILRPSRPVLHLAVAIALEMAIARQNGEHETSIGDLVFNEGLIDNIIQMAQECAELLEKTGRFSRSEMIVITN